MQKLRPLLYLLAAIVITIGFGVLLSHFTWEEFRDEIEAIEIEDIDLTTVSDGIFYGSYDANLIRAEVRVKVQNHRIISIDIVEHHHANAQAAEQIVDWIVESQTIEVDGVAGASYSVRVIQAAILNALRKGVNQNDES